MSNSTTPQTSGAAEIYYPLGLALGSVRSIMSLLICAFFWLILLWHTDRSVAPMLGHFFMLILVVLAFGSNPNRNDGSSSALPWFLRFLFVVGSLAVVGYLLYTDPHRLQARLTPDPTEFPVWWPRYFAIMIGGFSFGILLRKLLGETNTMFMTFRAWLAVLGMLVLIAELALVLMMLSTENRPYEFVQYWQAGSLAITSAYFGTRA